MFLALSALTIAWCLAYAAVQVVVYLEARAERRRGTDEFWDRDFNADD